MGLEPMTCALRILFSSFSGFFLLCTSFEKSIISTAFLTLPFSIFFKICVSFVSQMLIISTPLNCIILTFYVLSKYRKRVPPFSCTLILLFQFFQFVLKDFFNGWLFSNESIVKHSCWSFSFGKMPFTFCIHV